MLSICHQLMVPVQFRTLATLMGNPGGHQFTTYQFALLAGTFVLANLAAFWYLRKHFFSKRKGNATQETGKSTCTNSSLPVAILSPDEWTEFELIAKRKITHNSSVYRFKLPNSEDSLPLPIGQVMNFAECSTSCALTRFLLLVLFACLFVACPIGGSLE